jgi:hypothetical protein
VLDQRHILSRHFQSTSPCTPIDSHPERPNLGGSAASQPGLTRKPALRLTIVTAAATVLAVGTAATLVTLWPGMRLTAAATHVAPHRTPASAKASVASSRLQAPISIAASSRQVGQIRTVESWMTSHAPGQNQRVTLTVTVPPPPPQPKPVAPPAAPAPVASVTVPAASGSAQQIALAMLASYGWSSSEFTCLDPLWEHESGWNVYASNPDGAYGIPQALPGSKMASAGPDWQTDAATQIRWGLNYIQSRYGSPCAAWSHEEATGWY